MYNNNAPSGFLSGVSLRYNNNVTPSGFLARILLRVIIITPLLGFYQEFH